MTAPKSKKKVRLSHLMVEYDWLDDGKIQQLIDKFGEAGPTRYQRLACKIGREGGRLRKSEIPALGRLITCSPEAFMAFAEYAISIGCFYADDEFIYCKRIDEDVEGVTEKRNGFNERQQRHRRGAALSQHVTRDNPVTNGDTQESVRDSEHEHELEHERELEIESEKEKEPEAPVTGDPPDGADPELWDLTFDAFTPADDPICQGDTRFVGAGRRPLRKYPDVWLTQTELYQVFKTYIDAGVPKNKLSKGFQQVQSKLLTYSAEKRRVQSVSAFCWLTGFVLTDVLKELKASTDYERSKKYLEATQ